MVRFAYRNRREGNKLFYKSFQLRSLWPVCRQESEYRQNSISWLNQGPFKNVITQKVEGSK